MTLGLLLATKAQWAEVGWDQSVLCRFRFSHSMSFPLLQRGELEQNEFPVKESKTCRTRTHLGLRQVLLCSPDSPGRPVQAGLRLTSYAPAFLSGVCELGTDMCYVTQLTTLDVTMESVTPTPG